MRRSGGVAIPMRLDFEKIQICLGSQQILERMSELPAELPFAPARIEFLNQVSGMLLASREAKRYPDVVTFAFWIRKANVLRKRDEVMQEGKFRMGRGLVFHIAPSNVAVNYAYSFAVSFLLGNANIVRLPSKEFPQTDIINQAIRKVLEERGGGLENTMAFVRYSRSKEINDYFSQNCNVRIVWGGDETIREIRKSELPPRGEELTFADRYSICVIDGGTYISIPDKARVAQDFYNDTYLSDQNACSSPRLVCWTGQKDEVERARTVFWEELWKIAAEKYHPQPVQFMDKLVNACLAAVEISGIRVVKMKDNLITRIELESITSQIQERRGHSGFFYECYLNEAVELAPVCGEKLQTIACLGCKEWLMPLIGSGVKGIDRVVSIGDTMDFDFVWDGYDLVERLSREISIG